MSKIRSALHVNKQPFLTQPSQMYMSYFASSPDAVVCVWQMFVPITLQSYAKENQCIEINAVAVLFVQLPLFDSEAETTFSPPLVALLSAMILVSLEPPSSHFRCNLSVWPSAKKEPLWILKSKLWGSKNTRKKALSISWTHVFVLIKI